MLRFKTITEEKECRNLWEQFSKKQILWDLWDFRFCFHNKSSEFNFILGLNGKKKEGIIPLIYDTDCATYTYFGDTFPEQNKFFLKDKSNLKLFLKHCPEDTQIYYIDAEEAKYYDFKAGDKRYFLDLEKYGNSYQNYFKSFSRKHRKNLNYDFKKLKEKNYLIEKNNIKDYHRLVALNQQRFGEDSDYNEKDFVVSIKKLIDTTLKMNILDIISVNIRDNIEAVSLGVFYKNIYYVLSVGRNPNMKNLGKLLIVEAINSAIEHKCNKVDFLSTESNWKELWNLDSELMYEFEK